jgi:L-seryl-tRNA(Ser) seleniumtransferase
LQDWLEWEKRANFIKDAANEISHVQAEVYVPVIANHSPHVRVTWNPEGINKETREVEEALRAGQPSIEVKCDSQALLISVWMLRPGEERVVARRLELILGPGARSGS